MVVPSYEPVSPVHRLAASLVFQEKGNRSFWHVACHRDEICSNLSVSTKRYKKR
jgi:hypothetical protein